MMVIMTKATGLIAVVVGVLGFCIDLENLEWDISAAKVGSILFSFLAVELLIHQIFIENDVVHQAIHITMVLTASMAGMYGLLILRKYPIKFSRGRFKDILLYGSVIWLMDRHLCLAEFKYPIYSALFAISLLVALISFYVIIKITRLKVFFTMPMEPILCAYFVIFLIGESTLCMCVLPLLISAFVEFYLFYIVLRIVEPLLR